MDEIPPIVIDNGSSLSKAGFGGEENPRSIIPSVIGKLRRTINQNGFSRDSYVGNEISWRTGILSLEYPIEHGIVNNWDNLEKIWDYQFHHELKVDPAEQPILLTEIGDAYKSQREKMIQIMFETFNVPYFYIECQSVLSMISSGSLTGLSFESGDGCSYAIPVYDGYKIPHAIKKSKIAGKILNEWLNHLLREDGNYFDSSSEKEIVRDIKEKACYVSLDYKKEIKTIDSYYYKLPDENFISFREERIKCPELLFNPDLYKREDDGIQKIVYDSINSCDINIRQDLFKRIVISGGTTLFNGFIERLESEIKNLREEVSFGYNKVNVIRPFDVCQYCTWVGGSIWTGLARLDEHYISHEEYNDNGPGIVHIKCL